MKGVILAAGVSSRLRPLTDSKPKCLLKIGDNTILGRTVECLRKNRITDLIVVTGYYENQITSYFKKNEPDIRTEFIYNDVFDNTNNIYSLWLALQSGIDHDIILLDSDIIFDWRIIDLLLKSGKSDCLALRESSKLSSEEMKVRVDDKGSILEISKKIPPSLAVGESIGIEKFSRAYLDRLYPVMEDIIIGQGKVNIFYEAAFQETIESGSKIFAIPVGDRRCIEIDTPDDISSAEEKVVKYLD